MVDNLILFLNIGTAIVAFIVLIKLLLMREEGGESLRIEKRSLGHQSVVRRA